MKTEEQVREKLTELQTRLKNAKSVWIISLQWCGLSQDKNKLRMEFLRNNIAFIKWMLDEPCCKCYCHNSDDSAKEEE